MTTRKRFTPTSNGTVSRKLEDPFCAELVCEEHHGMAFGTLATVNGIGDFASSLSVAVEKTFDGKHPCKLCKLVQNGKAQEKKQDTQKPAPKLDKCVPAERMAAIQPPELERMVSPFIHSPSPRQDSPPVPPPERAEPS